MLRACFLTLDLLVILMHSWHDKAMLFEQYHWKKALEKGQPYKFKVMNAFESIQLMECLVQLDDLIRVLCMV